MRASMMDTDASAPGPDMPWSNQQASAPVEFQVTEVRAGAEGVLIVGQRRGTGSSGQVMRVFFSRDEWTQMVRRAEEKAPARGRGRRSKEV